MEIKLLQEPIINIQSHGIETSRYNSLLYLGNDEREYSLNCCGNRLILRSFSNHSVLIDQKVAEDAIMVITQCPILKDITQIRENNDFRYIRHATIRENKIAFCSEHGKELSKIVLFEFQEDNSLNILFEQPGGYRQCEFNSEGDLFAVRKYLKVENNEETLTYESQLIDRNTLTVVQKSEIICQKNVKMLQLIPSEDRKSVLLNSNLRHLIVQSTLDVQNRKIITYINLPGNPASPCIQNGIGFQLVQNKLILRIDLQNCLRSRDIASSHIELDVKVPQSIKQQLANGNIGLEIFQTSFYIKKDCYSMIINKSFTKLMLCLVNEIGYYTLNQSQKTLFTEEPFKLEEQVHGMFSITCCGSSLSKNKDLIAVGDYLGKIHIYCSKTQKILHQAQIDDQIRYMHFHDYHNEILLIATFSGAIYVWNNIGRENNNPKRILNLNRTVTSIRTSHGQVRLNPIRFAEKQYIIFGSIKGQLSLFSHDEYLPDGGIDVKDLTLEWSIIAHEPSTGPFDENFGSLQKQSEIWSTITNKGSLKRIVTCSEDQLSKVWSFEPGKNPQLIKTLPGHLKAVTSIDWQKMKDGKEYLVSCSDDKFVRIYSTEDDKYDLVQNINTEFITDWHTLTYLCMEQNGEHIAFVSENGYLFVWNMFTKKFVYSRKIHNGSIESLTWRGDTLVCCSSSYALVQCMLLLGVWSCLSLNSHKPDCDQASLKSLLFIYMMNHSFNILKESHDLTQEKYGYLTFSMFFYLNNALYWSLWIFSNYILLSTACNAKIPDTAFWVAVEILYGYFEILSYLIMSVIAWGCGQSIMK
ncbi:wd40 repeat-containing protein [Stylonychia lemnae]|uniref:Wd40 repeat-containing protein n=1 Tax=Stylonychia lemnae TaxID=5949 RepID=A0A078A4D1_STYLE|nr:wd40 repeat-containing protein [Stylonychia lemnae]|eukprot:CDW77113.1 wd40 repeat-containing protein [Stylonychia lemnae]